MSHASSISAASVRDIFRTTANKIPADLRRAIALLGLTSISDLEERLLATTAFLSPWAVYRDSCLLVNRLHIAEPSAITRLDILWFYTQFDEGLQRHDPRTERPGANFDIDKSGWSAAEHKKHLYAWLLQRFCVGKTHNSFGFQYFELRNICTAWEEIFAPIVKAVRASYSVKGRRHYGRLALFIEERCPSRLAFPEGNVSMPPGVINSPTPFRMVSRATHLRGASQTLLTKGNYDETERELRNVYPQYGGLVERPRFKQKMDEWLEVQRMRAVHRKTTTKPEVVQYVPRYQPQVVQQAESKNKRSPTKSPSPDFRSHSPLKRYSDSVRRSFSVSIGNGRSNKPETQSPLVPTRPKTPDTPKTPVVPYRRHSLVPKIPEEVRLLFQRATHDTHCGVQEPKNPLHGVTRRVRITDDTSDEESQSARGGNVTSTKLPDEDAWPLPAMQLTRPESTKQWLSEQSAYITVRESDPFIEDTPGASMHDDNSGDHSWSLMGAPSAIPPPLKQIPSKYDEPMPSLLLKAKKSYSEPRHPSYEGNGYREEISLSNLHSRKISAGSEMTVEDLSPTKPRSRLPAPIKLPPPYASQLRVASNDTHRNKAVEPPRSVARPGVEEPLPHIRPSHAAFTLAPPIPPKSPERWASKRGRMSEQLPHQHDLYEDRVSHEMSRIVSKEHIRGALSNLTPESSMEDLRVKTTRRVPTRGANPPRLETYNTHMFPRKRGASDGV